MAQTAARGVNRLALRGKHLRRALLASGLRSCGLSFVTVRLCLNVLVVHVVRVKPQRVLQENGSHGKHRLTADVLAGCCWVPHSLLRRAATSLQPLQSNGRASLPKSRLNSFLHCKPTKDKRIIILQRVTSAHLLTVFISTWIFRFCSSCKALAKSKWDLG